jgi:hypothetical protein
MKKYYFITYQGVRRDTDPSKRMWHTVIDISPMEYRQKLIDSENNAVENGRSSYCDFYIINCTRISKQEFEKWNNKIK